MSVFLEIDQRVRDEQLALELGVALGEGEQLSILVIELRLATWLLRRQRRGPACCELSPPREEMGAVDAFPAHQRLKCPALAGRQRSISRVQEPQPLSRCELAALLRSHALQRCAAQASTMLLALALVG